MATSVTYTATLLTRKYNSSEDAKTDRACQGFHKEGYNYVGIIHFAGMNLQGKIIKSIKLKVTAAAAGDPADVEKYAYFYASNYQSASKAGVTGGQYLGYSLGTLTGGSFYSNTTSYTLTSPLSLEMGGYIAQGKNTFCVYAPDPIVQPEGYSENYFHWTSVKLIVSYEEADNVPTLSANPVTMGTAVTINTNRKSSLVSHTLRCSFGGTTFVIAEGVEATYAWTPPVSLAARIPSATSGTGTIYCDSYYMGVLVGTNSCTVTLTVPSSLVPTVSTLTYTEAVSGIAAQFHGFVQTKSKLTVSAAAAGVQGSTITGYRLQVNGATYTGSQASGISVETGFLTTAGTNTISVTATDSRGRTATRTATFTVYAYSPVSLTNFKAERCNSAGTAPQQDGSNVRITVAGSAASVNGYNTFTCTVYYKLKSSSGWSVARTIGPVDYVISATNLLLTQTFDALKSYDLKVTMTDFFGSAEQAVSIATKQVLMDFFRDGKGIAFGKVAEQTNCLEVNDQWLTKTGPIRAAGAIYPNAAMAQDLGSWSYFFRNLYHKLSYYISSGFQYGYLGVQTEGTTETVGDTRLVLGNNKAAGTDGNAHGRIYLYGQDGKYDCILPLTSKTADVSHFLPGGSGTLVGTNGGSTAGGTAKPVYVGANGLVAALSATVGSATGPVYLNAGTISAVTSVAIAKGGTGATTAEAARENLGVKVTSLFSGTLSTGSTSFSADYNFYMITALVKSSSARVAMIMPKAAITTSAVTYQFADATDYYAFTLQLVGDNVKLVYSARSSTGEIKHIYGMN